MPDLRSTRLALMGSKAMYAGMTASEMANGKEQNAEWSQVAALLYIASDLALMNDRAGGPWPELPTPTKRKEAA